MIGSQDLLVALGLGLFFFGAKKLPELSRSLGQALVEFKKGMTGVSDEPREGPPSLQQPAVPSSVPETTVSKP
jgi:sec-independent protein translocase protein TatA